MMHKARTSMDEVLYCFSRSSVKFQGHTRQKINDFRPQCALPDGNSSLNFTDGYRDEVMHKAWRSIEEVPFCFPMSSVKFQGRPVLKDN